MKNVIAFAGLLVLVSCSGGEQSSTPERLECRSTVDRLFAAARMDERPDLAAEALREFWDGEDLGQLQIMLNPCPLPA